MQASLEFTGNGQKKIEHQFCGWKSLVAEGGQQRAARLIQADGKTAVVQITLFTTEV